MSNIPQVISVTPRTFTMTEDSDLSCTKGLWVEDDYAENGIGDILMAVGDNLYILQRNQGTAEFSDNLLSLANKMVA